MAYIGNTLAQGLISGANIQDGTIDTPDLVNNAITTAKIADGNVTLAKLSATGTKDATTFLRGDNTFQPTNANLTGPITSVGNATSIASQTGTGSKFVVDNTPTLITPVIGVATGTSLTTTGAVTGAELLASNGLVINNMTVGTTYAIPSGYSASSVGPVVISGGVTITVPSGSRWVVL